MWSSAWRSSPAVMGFPNLNDDDWLWGGSLDQIMRTIRYGARSGHAKTHEGQMLAFGRDGALKPDQIVTVAQLCAIAVGTCRPAQGMTRLRAQRSSRRTARRAMATMARATPRSARRNLTDKTLALRLRRGGDHRDHHQWPCRRDARMGGPARSLHHQGHGGLCPLARRRKITTAMVMVRLRRAATRNSFELDQLRVRG